MFDERSTLEDCLSWLLELRLKVRGNAYATGIVDRALAVCAKAGTADADVQRKLEAEIESIGNSLAMTLGAPTGRPLH